jgi:nitrate/nitrite transport system substrate-binding protein
MVMAVLEASRYVDDPANVEHVAAVLGRPAWVDAAPELIAGRLGGDYTDGRGARWHDPHGLKFFDGGAVNFPAAAHGMWFLSQFSRWGLAEGPIDYAGIANRISCTALYAEAAAALGIPVIDPGLAPVEFFDGRIWDPSRPEDYVRGFASAS